MLHHLKRTETIEKEHMENGGKELKLINLIYTYKPILSFFSVYHSRKVERENEIQRKKIKVWKLSYSLIVIDTKEHYTIKTYKNTFCLFRFF
jgi:hypothetical protein